jgi:lipid-A-disaccharide synthase-like uncharacterized protein
MVYGAKKITSKIIFMNFFHYFFTEIPDMRLPDIIIHVVAMLGALLCMYGVFLEEERRQDAVFMIGGLSLLVYALWIPNYIFIIATGLFTFASGLEFIQIVIGKHTHSKKS